VGDSCVNGKQVQYTRLASGGTRVTPKVDRWGFPRKGDKAAKAAGLLVGRWPDTAALRLARSLRGRT
jgi:hypothetical protein